MKLKDRIQNIKTLLGYCPKSSEDVMIYDEVCEDFFGKFFSNKARFKESAYESKVYAKISLHGILDANYKDRHYTISISYCYCYDRDGEDWTFYLFDDPECYFRSIDRPDIKYSEIPDNIWERIQNIVYAKAIENLDERLREAKSSVEYWEKKMLEFNNKLKLVE